MALVSSENEKKESNGIKRVAQHRKRRYLAGNNLLPHFHSENAAHRARNHHCGGDVKCI